MPHFRYIACERFEGNLYQFVRGEKPFEATAFEDRNLTKFQNIKVAIQVALQAVRGLAFVHHKGYVHKDVKPGNFVVRRGLDGEPKWVCKLTDLGQTRPMAKGTSVCEPTVRFGTPGWTAPEMEKLIAESNPVTLNRVPFGPKNDVWPMGCVLFFIFSGGRHPYGSGSDVKSNILKNRPLSLAIELSGICQPNFRVDHLVGEMIQEDVTKRPDMKKVVSIMEKWKLSEKSSASVSAAGNIREPKSPTVPRGIVSNFGKMGLSLFSAARTIVLPATSRKEFESDSAATNMIEARKNFSKIVYLNKYEDTNGSKIESSKKFVK